MYELIHDADRLKVPDSSSGVYGISRQECSESRLLNFYNGSIDFALRSYIPSYF